MFCSYVSRSSRGLILAVLQNSPSKYQIGLQAFNLCSLKISKNSHNLQSARNITHQVSHNYFLLMYEYKWCYFFHTTCTSYVYRPFEVVASNASILLTATTLWLKKLINIFLSPPSGYTACVGGHVAKGNWFCWKGRLCQWFWGNCTNRPESFIDVYLHHFSISLRFIDYLLGPVLMSCCLEREFAESCWWW